MNLDPKSSVESQDLPLIILVSSGYHLYREYLLKQVAGAARVWLFFHTEPTWEKPYIVGHTQVDTLDPEAMIEAAQKIPDLKSVRGVLCWDEVRMLQSADLAKALDLPSGDPESYGRCRDKHLTRKALDDAGVPQPTSILITSPEEAHAAAERIGYPLIFKPRALGASFGVSGVSSAEEIDQAYQHAREATEDGVPYYDVWVLVEECLKGPEISIDAACVEGRLYPMFVARKLTGFLPHYEEVGHVIDANDPLLSDEAVLDVLNRAHQAVAFKNGVTHTELMLTKNGPKVIEINCRLGGDLIPYVGYVATGINPGKVATQAACGVQPDVTPTHKKVAAVHFFYPSRNVTVSEVTVDDEALPAEVDTVGVLASDGQELLLPPDGHVTCRYAYAVVSADTVEGCNEALKATAKAITLRTQDGSEEVSRFVPGDDTST